MKMIKRIKNYFEERKRNRIRALRCEYERLKSYKNEMERIDKKVAEAHGETFALTQREYLLHTCGDRAGL